MSIQRRRGTNFMLSIIDEPITCQDRHFEIEITSDHIEIWELPPYNNKIAEFPDIEALAKALQPQTVINSPL